jgi:hypothetical protein
LHVESSALMSDERETGGACPHAACAGTVVTDASYCKECGRPVRCCKLCRVANRTEARYCRGCKIVLNPNEIIEWTDFGQSISVSIPYSTWVRPVYYMGYYWVVARDGAIFRVSPYASRAVDSWNRFPDGSFAFTPFTIYRDPSCGEEPFLAAVGEGGIYAVSLLNPEREKRLYETKAKLAPAINQAQDQYRSIAACSRGIAFFEKNREDDGQWLVIKSFNDELRTEIEDSVIVVGPVARGGYITFCTERRQHWLSDALGERQSFDFSEGFKPFSKRPEPRIANIAPGIVPLTIESSGHGNRSYVLGEVEGRLFYGEIRPGSAAAAHQRLRMLPADGAFVDLDGNGSLVINTSRELLALTAEGEKKRSSPVRLRTSMPGSLRGGDLIGFREGSLTPVLCRGQDAQSLGGDVDGCDENSVMGWMTHATGASLLLRRNNNLNFISWGTATGNGAGEHES